MVGLSPDALSLGKGCLSCPSPPPTPSPGEPSTAMTRPWAPLVRTRLLPLEMSGFRGAAVRLTDGACVGRRCRLLSGPGGHQNENRERPVCVLRILLCVCCERDPRPGQGWKRACRAPGWVVKTPQSPRQGRSGTSMLGEHPRGRGALPAPGVSSQAWRSAGCTGGPPRSPTVAVSAQGLGAVITAQAFIESPTEAPGMQSRPSCPMTSAVTGV